MSSSRAFADAQAAWSRGKGALLYGPPGTGKTRLISQIFRALAERPEATTGIVLDELSPEEPLRRPPTEFAIPLPAKVVWTTFHQSYGYEDFVLGLVPISDGATISIKPRLGLLMDALYELIRPDPMYKSVVLLIDELNRGNVARIFGEFITYLDVDYRDSEPGGEVNPMRLPLPLRQVNVNAGKTETLIRPGGDLVQFDWPIYFPRHVYLVATMNSTDRSAIPLDSALARRFERIELLPDLGVLATAFGQTLDDVARKAAEVRGPEGGESWSLMDAYTTSILLLDRINAILAAELGTEFELGHGLLLSVVAEDEPQRWARLASIWDDVLYPQIEDRFAGRSESLMELLKVEGPPGAGNYAWSLRQGLGGAAFGRSLAPVRLLTLPEDTQRRSLQWLAA